MMNIMLEKHGNQKKNLVLFHGWGFDSEIWRPFLPELTRFATVYLVDLPGFGDTPYMSWSDFSLCLLQRLPEKFVPVGWSLGGAYAMRLAINVQERAYQFVTLAASPKFISEPGWPGIDPLILNAFIDKFLLDPEKTLNDFLKLQGPHRTALKIGKAPTFEGLKAGLDVLRDWDLREGLSSVKGGMVFGKLDAIVPAQTAIHLQRAYPHIDSFTLRRASHIPFLSHTTEVIDYLKTHLFKDAISSIT